MTSGRRILYVVNAFENDAPTAISVAVGKAMKAAGWEVTFVACSRGGAMEAVLREIGVRTKLLGGIFPWNLAGLCKLVANIQPSIVHAALARPTISISLARLIMRNNQISWIASDHGVHEWREKGALRGRIMDVVMPKVLSAWTL